MILPTEKDILVDIFHEILKYNEEFIGMRDCLYRGKNVTV